jgi:hypothetical protein
MVKLKQNSIDIELCNLPMRRHFMLQKARPLLSGSVPESQLQFAVDCGNFSECGVKRAVQADGKVKLFLCVTV